MEWRDEGALLSVRKHGEGSAIIEVFTAAHGRHAGLVRGGGARRMAPVLQPGAQLSLTWKARLEDHLGAFSVEPLKSRAVAIMSGRDTLAAVGSIAALTRFLPERDPHPQLYARTIDLLDALGEQDDWPARYALWEAALLGDLGYGLDLSECAVTGALQDLVYVSPKSGRAVSRTGAGEWADRLLPLPRFLRLDSPEADRQQVIAALKTTGHFLENALMPAIGRATIPEARPRLLAALERG